MRLDDRWLFGFQYATLGLVCACSNAHAPNAPLSPSHAVLAQPAALAAVTSEPASNAAAGTQAPAPLVPTPVIGELAIDALPKPAYLEQSESAQLLNFDFIIHNRTNVVFRLAKVEVSIHDGKGNLLFRRFLDGNGVRPGIETVPERDFAAQRSSLIFNPIFSFPKDLKIESLNYELTLEQVGGNAERTLQLSINPVHYQNQAKLFLPLATRCIVWDGHDYFAHHRRWDYLFRPLQEFGFDSNAARYSYDFIPIDERGNMVTGEPGINENWFGFGKPILATAHGKVVAVQDNQADDRHFETAALKQNLLAVFGNYIIIEHGAGEFSLFGHIQHGSAKVKRGDAVHAGQQIANIGASGSSLMPHLHYQLQNNGTAHAEGVPSYFNDFMRVRDGQNRILTRGQVDSGDVLLPAPTTTKSRL